RPAAHARERVPDPGDTRTPHDGARGARLPRPAVAGELRAGSPARGGSGARGRCARRARGARPPLRRAATPGRAAHHGGNRRGDRRADRTPDRARRRLSRARGGASILVVRTAVLAVVHVTGSGRSREGTGGRLCPLEVALLLVEPGVHVVAHLEDGRAALAHRVVLAVVLCEQHGPHGLLLAIGQGEAQVGGVEPEPLQVLRGLRRDGCAAQLAQVVDEPLDGPRLRFLLALDRPSARLAVDERRAGAVLPLEDDPTDPVGAEAKDGFVAELPRILAERAERPVTQGDDVGLALALRVDLLLRALRGLVADQQGLRGVLAELDRHGKARLVQTPRGGRGPLGGHLP